VTEIVIISVLIVAREWTKKITVLWDVTCNLVEVYRSFEGTCCMHIQNRRVINFFSTFKLEATSLFETLINSKRLHSVKPKRQYSVYSQL